MAGSSTSTGTAVTLAVEAAEFTAETSTTSAVTPAPLLDLVLMELLPPVDMLAVTPVGVATPMVENDTSFVSVRACVRACLRA